MSKTVLITGGSRGIGAATAIYFAGKGYKVAITYNKSADAAEKLKKAMEQNKAEFLAIKCDVSDSAAVKEAVLRVEKEFGKIDVLVNNAGVSFVGLIQDTDNDTYRHVLDTNLSGAFYLSREVAPIMIKNGGGKIINIGSVWGKYGASCEVAYSMSKAGMRGLTQALAKELGPSGITVNCVEPGVIETDMNANFDAETLSDLANATPLCRLGKPDEVAEAVLFLASDKASFITGEFLGVNGGFSG
jgi:3-oxoacyl-[acyl-carrier protein] reductase